MIIIVAKQLGKLNPIDYSSPKYHMPLTIELINDNTRRADYTLITNKIVKIGD